MGSPTFKTTSKIRQDEVAEYFRAQALSQSNDQFSKTVCIKKYLPQFVSTQQAISILTGEIKTLSEMNHPNVLQILNYSGEEGKVALTQEFVNGITLHEIISLCKKQRNSIPWEICLYIAIEIGKALQYAHRLKGNYGPLKIIHRDINPENILISFTGQVKLTNFDNYILKKLRSKNANFEPFKTKLLYTSPEIIRGQNATVSADVFSLGTVLFEMLTLRHPFLDLELTQLLEAMGSTNRDTVQMIVPSIKSEISEVVEKAIASDPEIRCHQAQEFVAMLMELQDPKSISSGASQLEELLAEVSPKKQTPKNDLDHLLEIEPEPIASEKLELARPKNPVKPNIRKPLPQPQKSENNYAIILIVIISIAILIGAVGVFISKSKKTESPTSSPVASTPLIAPALTASPLPPSSESPRVGSTHIGTLDFSGPEGTEVYINGQKVGNLPLATKSLPTKSYTIIMKYKSEEKMKMVNVNSKEPATVEW